jgi:hypothetical protein
VGEDGFVRNSNPTAITLQALPSTRQNVPAALNRAREDLVTDTLRVSGRLTLPELLAGVGLPALFTDGAFKRLVDREIVAKSLAGGAETYELI